MSVCGGKTKHYKTGPNGIGKLPGAIHWLTRTSQATIKTWFNTIPMTQKVRAALESVADTVLPLHGSEKGLADRFVDFLSNKHGFPDTCEHVLPPKSTPSPFREFKKASEEDIRKLILDSPRKSFSLDAWPTFLVKYCIDILLPSITKLANYSFLMVLLHADSRKLLSLP